MMRYLITLLFFFSLSAQALDVPKLTRPIEDLANVIPKETKLKIEEEIRAIHKDKLAQISVLIVPSLEGEVLEDYSMRVAENWQLGSAEADNGVLLLLAINDRKMRLEVGNGIEGELTDYESNKIINSMKPFLRQQDYGQAVAHAVAGIKSIMVYYLPANIEARAEQARIEAAAAAKRNAKLITVLGSGITILFFILGVVFLFRGFNGVEVERVRKLIVAEDKELNDRNKKYAELEKQYESMKIDDDKRKFVAFTNDVELTERRKVKLEAEITNMKNYLGVN